MREVLGDHARRKKALKRGNGATMVSIDEVSPATDYEFVDVLALDQALTELVALDERMCRVVELRFFAGLSIEEAAVALDVSSATVEREWAWPRDGCIGASRSTRNSQHRFDYLQQVHPVAGHCTCEPLAADVPSHSHVEVLPSGRALTILDMSLREIP